MKLTSNDFIDQELLDEKFTCDGEGISPHLKWEDFPAETRSFALSCADPDAPGGDFVHWLMYNIPLGITEIDQGASTIEEADDVKNDFGKAGYGGPCPPSGVHRYIFTVYALPVNELEYITRDNFFEKIKEASIANAQIIGKYGVE